MQVCMVTLDNPLHNMYDGITSHVNFLSKSLQRLNCTIWILSLDNNVKRVTLVESNGIIHVCIPCRWNNLLMKMTTLLKSGTKHLINLEKEYDIDIFHGHGGYVGPIAMATFSNGRKIMTLHTTYEEEAYTFQDYLLQRFYLQAISQQILYHNFILEYWRNWYFKKMNKIISVTKHNITVTSKKYGLPIELFNIVYNGADLTEIKRFEQTQKSTAEENHIIYYGRLAPRKGVQLLLHAMQILLKTHPKLHLSIVGDGVYRSILRNISTELGLTKNVTFYGFLERKRLLKMINDSTIVIIPSLYEGVPLTLFESAAFGKPIIASSLPGICEVMIDQHTCLLFPPGDVKQLAASITKLLSDPSLRHELGKNARNLIEKKYTWNHAAEKTIKIYQKML